ncbi:phosphodiester glycosidase family protein [Phycisphaera mikurensis]|uniref:phosphodiester glycosidase family protein n=1 Tax=Phycisphaera mikurensis TaxID=547188 RepID=UPI00059BD734|nr:phosphodiester glycosidase family protein [Phycisphaera mikurensis]MBB6441261.1 hypothetical protein [Phycisphaera mikurensis]
MSLIRPLLAALVLAPGPCAAAAGAAESPWVLVAAADTPAQDGPVAVQEARLETPAGPVRGLLAQVDLTDPRVEVVVTERPAEVPPPPAEVPRVGVAGFAAERGLAVAVNANYFATLGPDADVLGLCVADGVVVSPARFFAGTGDPVLAFAADGTAAAFVPDTPEDPRLAAFDAVAGIGASPTDPDRGGLLVEGGVSRGGSARVEPLARHPRTVAGVDAGGGVLTLAVIDGREAGGSAGATLPEAAALLLQAGVSDGVNLDGGGSSVMYVGPGVAGAEAFTSSPSEDRPVAAILGVRLRESSSR